MTRFTHSLLLLLAALPVGCVIERNSVPRRPSNDASLDVRADAPTDGGLDTRADTPSFDTGLDTPSFDTGLDTPSFDTGLDTPSFDTGLDTPSFDTPRDVGFDTPSFDTGFDTPRDVGFDTPSFDVGSDAPRDVGSDTPRDVGTDTPRDVGSDAPRDAPMGCMPAETCNQRDDDCDGQVDEAACGSGNCTSSTFGGHVYLRCTTLETWAEARTLCMSYGYDLAIITSSAENSHVHTGLERDSWIGLRDTSVEGTFVWIGGMPLSYENFNGDPPTNDDEDCVTIRDEADAFWSDYPCGTLDRHYLCEANILPRL